MNQDRTHTAESAGILAAADTEGQMPPYRRCRNRSKQHLWSLVVLLDRSGPILFVAATLSLFYCAFADQNAGIVALFVLLMVPGMLLLARAKGQLRDSEWRVFLTVFSFAVLATCATYRYYLQTNRTAYPYGLADDDYRFDSMALDIYQSDLSYVAALQEDIKTAGSGTWHRAYYYSIVLAHIYRGMHVLGFAPHPLYPRLVNSLLLAGIALMVHAMALRCTMPFWGSRFSAYLCGLSPFMIFACGHTYRDTLNTFGVTAFTCAMVAILVAQPRSSLPRTNWNLRYLLLLSLGAAIAAVLRETYLPIMILTALVCTIVSRLAKGWSIIAGGGIALLVGVAIHATGVGLSAVSDDLEKLEYYHKRHADASGNITGAVFRLPYIVSIPARFVLRNVSPLPLPQKLVTENYQRIGTVLWFLGLPFLFRSLSIAFRRDCWAHTRALRIVACCFLAFYLLNIATTLQDRHVVMYIPTASVLITNDLAKDTAGVGKSILGMACLALLLVVIYFAKRVFSA